MITVLLLLTCGPPNPVDGCPGFPVTDCCETDAQCEEHYGWRYPNCHDGLCASCKGSAECAPGEVCIYDDWLGVAFCCAEPPCAYPEDP